MYLALEESTEPFVHDTELRMLHLFCHGLRQSLLIIQDFETLCTLLLAASCFAEQGDIEIASYPF